MTVENKPQTQQNKQDDTNPETVRINCLTPFLESGRKLKLPLEEPTQEPRRMCITNLIRSYEQNKKPLDVGPLHKKK